jgi:hypothetical protein
MSVDEKRKAELQKTTREGVLYLLESDLKGGSENLKDVYEEAVDHDELKVVNAELERIVRWLKGKM